MTHTKEPWAAFPSATGSRDWFIDTALLYDAQSASGFVIASHIVEGPNARRIVDCVNALEGIPDPAAFVAAFEAMRDALGELEASIERRWEGESDRKRANSVSPRTEDALEAARTALTLAKQVKP